MRHEHSATALALLARIGQTSSTAIWAEGNPAIKGEPDAKSVLATATAMAITRIDDAERRAAAALHEITTATTRESGNAANGYTRDAGWLTQATAKYATEVARISAEVANFYASAFPLALILGWNALDEAPTTA